MKPVTGLIICFIIGYLMGSVMTFVLFCNNDNKEALQARQIQIIVLQEYKNAFMNHITKCDTMHKNCFKYK